MTRFAGWFGTFELRKKYRERDVRCGEFQQGRRSLDPEVGEDVSFLEKKVTGSSTVQTERLGVLSHMPEVRNLPGSQAGTLRPEIAANCRTTVYHGHWGEIEDENRDSEITDRTETEKMLPLSSVRTFAKGLQDCSGVGRDRY